MPAPPMSAGAVPAASSWRDALGIPRVLIAVGILIYAVSLAATLPARVVAGAAAAGTVWHGTAALPGGEIATWDWLPVDSIAHAAVSARWTIDGRDTLLTGIARRPAFSPAEVANVTGRAAWRLLASAVPGLPADCAIPLTVAVDHAAANGATGTISSRAGTCPGNAGSIRAIPRLVATFAGATGQVTPWLDHATILATVAMTRGTIRLHVTPAGAAVLPGAGRAGDLEVGL